MKEIIFVLVNFIIKKLLFYVMLEEKVNEEYKKYVCLLSWKLYSIEVNGEIISCIGVEFFNLKRVVIKYIVVLLRE